MRAKYINKLHKFVDYYVAVLGACIVIFWIMYISKNTAFKIEIYFHIFSEILMAILCIMAVLIKSHVRSYLIKIVALSMLIYSTLNAAGFYAEKDSALMLIIFVLLFVVSFLILAFILFSKRGFNHQT